MRMALRIPARRAITLPKIPGWVLALFLIIAVPATFALSARSYMVWAWTYYGGTMIGADSSMKYTNAVVALIERASYLTSGAGDVRFQWDPAPSSQATRYAVTDLGSLPMKPLRPVETDSDPDLKTDAARIVRGPDGILAVAVTGRGGSHCKRHLLWLSSYSKSRIRVARIPTPSRYEEETDLSATSATWGARGEWDHECGESLDVGTLLIRFD